MFCFSSNRYRAVILLGMAEVTKEAGVRVAADESCPGLADAKRLLKYRACDVFNLKLAKVGIADALKSSNSPKWPGLI